MITWFQSVSPVWQALLAGGFTWAITAIGAGTVFLKREMPRAVLDSMLAFAAGAMIFVVVEEIIPTSQQEGHGDLATLGTIAGFAFMMVLDVSLG